MIGIFSDSYGDLAAFDAAYQLLSAKGARRFFFAGGRYSDLDEWILLRRERARGGKAYSDGDFLADVSSWLDRGVQNERPPAFGAEPPAAAKEEDFASLQGKFIRVPERECLQYRDPNIPHKVVDMIGDNLCCIVHDKNDLDRDDIANATYFIHGKEPEPKVVRFGPRFFVTPGKLTGAAEQTCGLLAMADKALRFYAFRLDGKQLLDESLAAERKTKLSVK